MLTTNASSLKNAQKRLQKTIKLPESDEMIEDGNAEDNGHATLVNEIFNTDPQIPDAVYFCSIEPPSLATQNAMEAALKQLQREDPSLRVNYDSVTGQTVLGGKNFKILKNPFHFYNFLIFSQGMGELHMDIVKSRILTEYKIDVDLGPLQIAYKETIEEPALDNFQVEKEIAGSKQSVNITLELLREQNEPFRQVYLFFYK